MEFLHHKAKKAKLDQKEVRSGVQSALAAGLKKKKKKKKAEEGKTAPVLALPVFGM